MRTLLFAPLVGLLACTGSSATGTTKESTAANNKPVAEAGTAITQTADAAVDLNGGGSRDPDGDTLSFKWSFDHVPDGSLLPNREAPFTVNLSPTPTTSFMPDAVGTYVVKLVVTDSRGAESDPDFVVVTIEDPTTLPIANAGTDLTVSVGQTVTLSGAGSYDPQGRPFTYAWTLIDMPTGSASTVTSPDTVAPTLIPDTKGVYVLNLVVNNGLASSHGDAVTVTALADDHAPVANAGVDVETEDCTTVQLDCAQSSDPDKDTLTYLWEVQAKPTGSAVTNSSFSSRSAARPTFYPDVAGDYTLSCSVYDGTSWSSPDLMRIAATERRKNSKPSVNAGANETADAGTAACTPSGYVYDCDYCADLTTTLGLNATVTDADGDPYTVYWEVVDGTAKIADPTSLATSVTLQKAAPTEPGKCESTEYTFKVTATDCTGESDNDTIVYKVNCCGYADTN